MNAITIAARDAWDACADAYADHRALWSPIEDLAHAALAARRGERVLDVGCGPGTLAVRLAREGARVTAIDLSPRMVALTAERAAAHGVHVDARAMDASRLDLPSGSHDAIVSCLTFHLLTEPAVAAREAARVLAPGGRAVVTTWGPAVPGSPSEALLHELPGPGPRPAPQTEVHDALLSAGFDEVDRRVGMVRLAAPLATWVASFLDGSPLRALLRETNERDPLARRMRDALAPHADARGVVQGDVAILTHEGRLAA